MNRRVGNEPEKARIRCREGGGKVTSLVEIQRHVGVTADGRWGPLTADAIAKALGMKQPQQALEDSAAFFKSVRELTGKLDQMQVDSINLILKHAAHWSLSWAAYGLATAWHEARFRPIEEWGRGAGRPYARAGKYGQSQHGRGFVQLTWDRNYEWADRELGLGGSLTRNFNRALEPDIAAQVLIKGMEQGAFTGKGLRDYLPGWSGTEAQFIQARRIVNGTDKAKLIAGYAEHFQRALEKGGWI